MRDPIDLEPGQGHVMSVADATLTIKSGDDGTGGTTSLLEGVFQPGGFAPLPHIHREAEESFYVLEGRFAFRIDDRRFDRDAGSFIHVPAGRVHGFAAAGDQPGRILVLHAPPLDRFFLELAELTGSGPLDRGAVARLMSDWGMDVPAA